MPRCSCFLARLPIVMTVFVALVWVNTATAADKVFRAGAHAQDITPTNFPATINGSFTNVIANGVTDKLYARALVLDDSETQLVIVVVDSCMMPRELLDKAKALAQTATGIPTDRMLISATHTHTAPATMGCLGAGIDEPYTQWLPLQLADAIKHAHANLAPARIGWTVTNDWQHTNCRRWVTRPDKMLVDPFGVQSVRAMMHPGYQNPNYIAPAGPIDPGLSLLAVQSRDGRPLALLANYSMHYFGSKPVSADYFGKFALGIGKLMGATDGEPAFVGMISQGTSGDSHWMDYSQPQKKISVDEYAEAMLQSAAQAIPKIEYRDHVTLAMAEAKLKLSRRLADEDRLAWAREVVAKMGDRLPKDRPEVYAREQLYIAAEPERELKLQAVRIGDFGITAIPNEVYAITGLKLKAQSPLQPTMNIELANGGDGYIPPPEQHKLGGYTTWAARTAGLEVQAEPQIVETVLTLLEKVAGKKRIPLADTHGPYAEAVLASKPVAYWRLNEFVPPTAHDATGNKNHARYEDGIAMYLPGAQSQADAISAVPENPSKFSGNQINRAPHLAGGRIVAELPKVGKTYSVELWFWNGLASDVRESATCIFSRGIFGGGKPVDEHLDIGGKSDGDALAGKLRYYDGIGRVLNPHGGRTSIDQYRWHHLVLVRDPRDESIYLDGKLDWGVHSDLEIEVTPSDATHLFYFGGRSDGSATFEGKLDEIAVYDRALTADEIAKHYQAAGRKPSTP